MRNNHRGTLPRELQDVTQALQDPHVQRRRLNIYHNLIHQLEILRSDADRTGFTVFAVLHVPHSERGDEISCAQMAERLHFASF